MGSSGKEQLFVRSFRPGDEDSMVHIFRETADEVLRNAGDPALHYASHVWCRPYFILASETCFVVDDGHGKAVGYIIGTSDTRAFVDQWRKQFLPLLDQQDIPKPGPEENISWNENLPNTLRFLAHSPDQLLHEDHPELLAAYAGHLHIDILTEFQRFGMGRKLMETFLSAMRKNGTGGVHLGMNASNNDAMQFYQRMGLKRFGKVMDGGVSGEEGQTGTTVYMVISL